MISSVVLPVLAAGDGLLSALFVALMIIIWLARQFGGNNQPNQPLPRRPRPPRPGGRPPAGPRAPQEAAGQLQKEIEVFLGQIRQKSGQPEPKEDAGEPVFDGGRDDDRRASANAPPRRVARATRHNEPAYGSSMEARPTREQAARAKSSESRTGDGAGKRPQKPADASSGSLSTSELGSELRQHLKDYMTEDRLPKHIRDRLVDEVEAHLGRIADERPARAARGGMRQKLLQAVRSQDQVRQAILINEVLTPVSRRPPRR